MFNITQTEFLNLKECADRYGLEFTPYQHKVGMGGVCPALRFSNLRDFARFIASVQRSYRSVAELLTESDIFSDEESFYTVAYWPDIDIEQEEEA